MLSATTFACFTSMRYLISKAGNSYKQNSEHSRLNVSPIYVLFVVYMACLVPVCCISHPRFRSAVAFSLRDHRLGQTMTLSSRCWPCQLWQLYIHKTCKLNNYCKHFFPMTNNHKQSRDEGTESTKVQERNCFLKRNSGKCSSRLFWVRSVTEIGSIVNG